MERNSNKIEFIFKINILKKMRNLVFNLIPKDNYKENEDDKEEYEYPEEEKDDAIDDLNKIIEKQKNMLEKIEKKVREMEDNDKT